MSYADQIRAYCAEKYVAPSRKRGSTRVEIPVREVHDALGFTARFPLVCSALRAGKFSHEQRLIPSGINGPEQSSTTVFIFSLQ